MLNLYAITQGAGCFKHYNVCILKAKYCDILNQCSVNIHSSSMHKPKDRFTPDDKTLDDKTTYYSQNEKYLLFEIC